MQTPRWAGTTAAMCGVAWALRVLGADATDLQAALTDPQLLVDTTGPDALLLALATALAWLCWAWGVVGLLLTATSAVPGWAGRLAGVLLSGLLPAGARRAAALAIGVGLTATAPFAVPTGPPPVAVALAAADQPAGPTPVLVDWPGHRADALDWPTAAPPDPAPDWPSAAPAGHVVLRGDCLWDIARDQLARGRPGVPVADAEVAEAVQAWWRTNAAVIGPDPDLLLPGQVLQPPH